MPKRPVLVADDDDGDSSKALTPARRGRDDNGRLLAAPAAPSWELKLSEDEVLYRAEIRVARLGQMGVRGVEAIAEIDEYIRSKGDLDEATSNECRQVQATVARVARTLIELGLLGR